jgi:hypothetical protein
MRNALYTGGTCSKEVSPSQEKNMVSFSPSYIPKSLAYKENVESLFRKIKVFTFLTADLFPFFMKSLEYAEGG